MGRKIEIVRATRSEIPLFIGLWAPSNGGKTFTALRLATGIQRITPGPIVLIDTENGRGRHYADDFNYEYTPFDPPFNSLDYLDVLQQVEAYKPSVIILDSFSHEHSGDHGYLETQNEKSLELAKKWNTTPEKTTMPAWAFVAAQRKKLLQHIIRMDTHLIACFRAKETSAPVKKKNGKMGIENLGYMPEAGKQFVFEMTLAALLPPGSDGRAHFQTGNKGEDMMTKLPLQFRKIFHENGIQMTEDIGEKLARWAKGDTPPVATGPQPKEAPTQTDASLFEDIPKEKPERPSENATEPERALFALKSYMVSDFFKGPSKDMASKMIAWLSENPQNATQYENRWPAVLDQIRKVESEVADTDIVDHGLILY